MFVLLNILIIFSYFIFSYFFENLNIYLLEDSVVEYAAAFLLFISSFLLLLKIKLFNKKIIISGYIFFMFLAAGEEVSWGQRVFNIKTPDSIAKHNMQNEFNLHNLEIFNRRDKNGDKKGIALLLSAEMLYNLIAIGLFFVLPLISKFMGPFKQLIPTKEFVLPIILIFLCHKIFLLLFGNIQTPIMTLQRGLGELKETFLSVLFALHGFRLATQIKKS